MCRFSSAQRFIQTSDVCFSVSLFKNQKSLKQKRIYTRSPLLYLFITHQISSFLLKSSCPTRHVWRFSSAQRFLQTSDVCFSVSVSKAKNPQSRRGFIPALRCFTSFLHIEYLLLCSKYMATLLCVAILFCSKISLGHACVVFCLSVSKSQKASRESLCLKSSVLLKYESAQGYMVFLFCRIKNKGPTRHVSCFCLSVPKLEKSQEQRRMFNTLRSA